jgi:hypothetical protein
MNGCKSEWDWAQKVAEVAEITPMRLLYYERVLLNDATCACGGGLHMGPGSVVFCHTCGMIEGTKSFIRTTAHK